jgi:hypothetical protein
LHLQHGRSFARRIAVSVPSTKTFAALPRRLSSEMALLFAPFPRRLSMSCPHAATIVLGLLLRTDVVRRIAAICEGLAASDQPKPYILAPDPTGSDGPPIAVNILLSTRHGRLSDKFVQSHRSVLSAAVGLVRGVETWLPLLRRINPMEADALSLNFDCIAVYDRRSPHDVSQADAREQYQGCNYEQARRHADLWPFMKAQCKNAYRTLRARLLDQGPYRRPYEHSEGRI